MSTQRMIDAARNRGGEAIRSLEDLARFVLEDAALSRDLKTVRHGVQAVCDACWPGDCGLWHRDTAGDPGTGVSTSGEYDRRNLGDIAAAASRRAAEALRTLEEAAKCRSVDAAREIESARYSLYDLAASVQKRLGAGGFQWAVCLLLMRDQCTLPWREVLTAAIEGGAECVQVRAPHMNDAALLRHIEAVVEICRPAGVAVVVNDRVDLALAGGADGVHLGQGDVPIAAARRLAGRELLIGISTHGATEVTSAVRGGADYVGIGPIFATGTKPDLEPAGPSRVVEALPLLDQVPHLALGGIDGENAHLVAAAGARGCAIGRAICAASDPAAVTRACVAAFEAVRA